MTHPLGDLYARRSLHMQAVAEVRSADAVPGAAVDAPGVDVGLRVFGPERANRPLPAGDSLRHQFPLIFVRPFLSRVIRNIGPLGNFLTRLTGRRMPSSRSNQRRFTAGRPAFPEGTPPALRG